LARRRRPTALKFSLSTLVTASEKTPTQAALIAGFAAIYLIWGSTYLGIRVVVETIPPFLMASLRFFVAGGIIAAFIALTRGFKASPRQWRDNALIGGFLCLGGNGLVSWAEQKIPSGIATLIISVGPLFIVLLDWAAHAIFRDNRRGTRPTALTFIGLALGFTGLAVLVGPDVVRQGVNGLDGWSVLGLIGACLFWGVGMIYTKYAHEPVEPFTGAAIQMLTGGAWLLLVSLLCREPAHVNLAAISGRSVVAWCYLVVFGSLIGFTTFVWLMKHSTPARVSTYAYVNPIVAVFLGWWILHEPISPRLFTASAIIIAGVAIITTQKNKKSLVTPPRQAVCTTTPAALCPDEAEVQ
jgi:drug/metabolite transporter (DMT)-like permease